MTIPWLDPELIDFPDTHSALDEPNGLLAVGGDLSPGWLQEAYRRGIFPWYEQGQPIMWWTPEPRLILEPGAIHLSRSLRKLLRQGAFEVTLDRAFAEVVEACAAPREESSGTWITTAMRRAYQDLHGLGIAHSLEVWNGPVLAGGIYGIALGKAFFGESMFSRRSNGSKIALVYLANQLQKWGFELIDCQVSSPHLLSLGARAISREEFETRLDHALSGEGIPGPWQLDDSLFSNAID